MNETLGSIPSTALPPNMSSDFQSGYVLTVCTFSEDLELLQSHFPYPSSVHTLDLVSLLGLYQFCLNVGVSSVQAETPLNFQCHPTISSALCVCTPFTTSSVALNLLPLAIS